MQITNKLKLRNYKIEIEQVRNDDPYGNMDRESTKIDRIKINFDYFSVLDESGNYVSGADCWHPMKLVIERGFYQSGWIKIEEVEYKVKSKSVIQKTFADKIFNLKTGLEKLDRDKINKYDLREFLAYQFFGCILGFGLKLDIGFGSNELPGTVKSAHFTDEIELPILELRSLNYAPPGDLLSWAVADSRQNDSVFLFYDHSRFEALNTIFFRNGDVSRGDIKWMVEEGLEFDASNKVLIERQEGFDEDTGEYEVLVDEQRGSSTLVHEIVRRVAYGYLSDKEAADRICYLNDLGFDIFKLDGVKRSAKDLIKVCLKEDVDQSDDEIKYSLEALTQLFEAYEIKRQINLSQGVNKKVDSDLEIDKKGKTGSMKL